jgi:N-acetylglucosaminyl-diphospho-decaprenol L-rhamnosyltransferase
MRLSVVVVTYNSEHCIQACLVAVQRMLGRCELVVVDNLSEDATLERATAIAPDARIVEMGRNAGFGRACNAGVRAATCEHVMLMNPDVVLGHVDRALLDNLMSEDQFGLMAPGLAFDHDAGTAQPQMFARASWLSELATMALGPFRPKELPRRARLAPHSDALWACGALVIVRKREFVDVGGFDERFFLYYEDQELGTRYRRARLPLRGTDAIWGVHAAGTSSSGLRDRRIEPMAWCLLSWLELVAMDYGSRRATVSWVVVQRTHRMARRVLRVVVALTESGRLRRKMDQLEALEQTVSRILASGGDGERAFCPMARKVIARA